MNPSLSRAPALRVLNITHHECPKNCMHNTDCIFSPALNSFTTLSLLFFSLSFFLFASLSSFSPPFFFSLSFCASSSSYVLFFKYIFTCVSLCLPRSFTAFHGSRIRASRIVAAASFSLLGFMLRFFEVSAMKYLPLASHWRHEEEDCLKLFCCDFRSCSVYEACLVCLKLFVCENDCL